MCRLPDSNALPLVISHENWSSVRLTLNPLIPNQLSKD